MPKPKEPKPEEKKKCKIEKWRVRVNGQHTDFDSPSDANAHVRKLVDAGVWWFSTDRIEEEGC